MFSKEKLDFYGSNLFSVDSIEIDRTEIKFDHQKHRIR